MICKNCYTELTSKNTYPLDHRYCIKCGEEHSAFLSDRHDKRMSKQIVTKPFFW